MITNQHDQQPNSRRRFLRNAGLAGGAAWVAPQIVASTPAFASVSDPDCITIDDFTVAQLLTDDQNSPGTALPSATVVGPLASIIGGQRSATLVVDKAFNGGQDASLAMENGGLYFDTGFRQTAISTLTYANGPFDLTPATKIMLSVGIAAVSAVKITLSLDGQEQSKLVGDTNDNLEVLTWTIADFPVDATNLSSIVLTIDTTAAGGAEVRAADTGGECFFACP